MSIERDILNKVRLGMTREEVRDVLGEPDLEGGSSRKYPTASIYKYGDIELFFDPWKTGTLYMVYTEDAQGNGRVLLGGLT